MSLTDLSPLPVPPNPQRLLAAALGVIVWTAAAAGAGYLYRAHTDQVKDAGTAAKQEAVTTTTSAAAEAIDTTAVARLAIRLSAADARARSLEQMIKDQAHATPAPPDCRLPDRLRDKLNAGLAAGRPAPAGQVW